MRAKSELRPSQVAMLTEMYERDEGIMVLEPGGGKTASALTAILERIEDGVIDRALVLAPPRVAAGVWPAEPSKWEHLSGAVVIDATGSPKQRRAAYARWTKGTILCASLDNAVTVKKEVEALDLRRTMLVIDEISKLKAPTGVLAEAVGELSERCQSVWGLTGSPRPNGWQDLYRPIRIVSRGRVWGDRNFTEWRKDYFRQEDHQGYVWKVHTFAEPLLEEAVRPLMFTAPAEHYDTLPPLNAGPDFDIVVDLPGAARAAYDKMERDGLVKVLRDLGDNEEAVVVALSEGVVSGKLSQIAQGYLYDEGAAIHVAHSAKLDALDDLLTEVGRDPAVVAYGYKQDVESVVKRFGATPTLGGGTSAGRGRRYIEAFSRGEIGRLALHPASAGHGVDGLQLGGRYLFWLCPTWSQELYQQTLRRLWRPGQTRPVYSRRIIARDTIDELKVARVEGKAAQEAAFKKLLARAGL